ncbi:hypothetical protein N0V82_005617 [Gnomoniopsis sp. IMI 355080]|nr:hypothetical protein N0V82_005617 [Gnomoniopsis sp. IMI 355080]
MLIGNTKPELILVRAAIFLFSYVGLICFAYFIVAAVTGGVKGITNPFSIVVEVFGAIEIVWYLAWFLPFQRRLRQAQRPVSRALSRAEREQAFYRGIDNVPDVEEYVRGWFGKAHLEDIRRDNLKDWLLWSLFGRDGAAGADEVELEEYIEELEERLGFSFKPGRGDAKALRPGCDPVKFSHRSLFFYTLVGIADLGASIFLLIKGFSFYRQPRLTFFKIFPFRPLILLSPDVSAAPGISYFSRPHKSSTHRPIVFIHGGGIGLPPHLPWLNQVPPDIGILAIELLPVSNRICPPMAFGNEFADGILNILYQHGTVYDDFVLVAHDYGTLLVNALLQHPKLDARIDSILLLDPLSLLLHLPDVAYSLTRRKPRSASQWAIWWGLSRDPSAASVLARALGAQWRDMALSREQLMERRTTVVLGSEDDIVHTKAVASCICYWDVNCYDCGEQREEEFKMSVKRWTGMGELELIYLDGVGHGEVVLTQSNRPTVQQIVHMYCYRDKRLGSPFREGRRA